MDRNRNHFHALVLLYTQSPLYQPISC